jgi:hypothetical protein
LPLAQVPFPAELADSAGYLEAIAFGTGFIRGCNEGRRQRLGLIDFEWLVAASA